MQAASLPSSEMQLRKSATRTEMYSEPGCFLDLDVHFGKISTAASLSSTHVKIWTTAGGPPWLSSSLQPQNQMPTNRIANIHMAAFASNIMLQAQFPTPAIRHELRTCIAQKATDDIRDPKSIVLVVRDEMDVISFVKWAPSISKLDPYQEPPWHWPEGTNHAILDQWIGKVEAARRRVLGDAPCCRKSRSKWPILLGFKVSQGLLIARRPDLNFIATAPEHERRGAASTLMKWALAHCERNGVPMYVESTVDAGPFYMRHRFEPKARISMGLEGMKQDGGVVEYEEFCWVFTPKNCLWTHQLLGGL